MEKELISKRVHLKDKDVKAIYEKSFRRQEKFPFFMMVFSSLFPFTKFRKYIYEDKTVGFIYYGVGFSLVFLMFFAVDDGCRGLGIGSKIVNEVVKKYPNKSIITSIGDITGDDKEHVIKRKHFYLKNNFNEANYYLRIRRINEEVLTANKKFNKFKFRIFITFYSFFTLYPKIRKIKK